MRNPDAAAKYLALRPLTASSSLARYRQLKGAGEVRAGPDQCMLIICAALHLLRNMS